MKAQAILYLHKAIDEGFKDRQQLQQDQQLATLHGTLSSNPLLTQRRKSTNRTKPLRYEMPCMRLHGRAQGILRSG